MPNKKGVTVAAFCVLVQVASVTAAFADVIWLSEAPPPKYSSFLAQEMVSEPHAQLDHSRHPHEHPIASSGTVSNTSMSVSGGGKHQRGGRAEVDVDGEVVSDNIHSGNKQVWVRNGDDPCDAPYMSGMQQGVLTLMSQSGNLPSASLTDEKGLATAKLDFPDLGFYNAYWIQRTGHDGVLDVQVAKAELLHGTCCSKDVDDAAVAKPIINASMPLELVREHYPKEKLFTRIVSGDTVNFTVLGKGLPIAGAKVTMISHNGWRSSQISDASGRVSFTMIRDYYPSWLEFKKRHKQNYLITAELDVPGKSVFEGVTYKSARYTTTLAGNYYPSPHDYRSYAWGLGIALFVIVFGGLAVYLYRRRRLKPYQEVRVDDKA